MNTCYVCGSTLDEGAAQCPKCQTELYILEAIGDARSEPRFLFGSVKNLERPTPEGSQGPTPKSRQKAPPIRKSPNTAAFEQQATVLRRKPVKEEEPTPLDLIKNRDFYIEDEVEKPKQPVTRLSLALFLDTLCCLALNAIVLAVIISTTGKDPNTLIKYSLIPMLLVFVTISLIYFGLFQVFFHKTLGGLLVTNFEVSES